ncbi:Ig-like domain-containing protein [Streptomyces sp. NPDC017993]|uniref:Ig-like domain-containing protein n=1 Tax=Streptomyces sp. NPDC017993 TaxID=3365027 RepID=UPI0037B998CE
MILFPTLRPSRPSPRLRATLALIPLAGLGALTACGGSAASASAGDAVQVGLGAANGTRTVQAGDRLRVTAAGGVLTDVTVTDPKGRQLAGRLGEHATAWTSDARASAATKYSVVARTRNDRGDTGEAKESVTTAAAAKLNRQMTGGEGTSGQERIDRHTGTIRRPPSAESERRIEP